MRPPGTPARTRPRVAEPEPGPAVVDDIRNDQLEPDFTGDMQRPSQRVHRKVRPSPMPGRRPSTAIIERQSAGMPPVPGARPGRSAPGSSVATAWAFSAQ